MSYSQISENSTVHSHFFIPLNMQNSLLKQEIQTFLHLRDCEKYLIPKDSEAQTS